jgi:hypothetical protein
MQGLFLASFVTSLGGGTVAFFACDGEVWGGDAHFCFSGRLRQTGKFISAALKVRQHTPGRRSVFGDLTVYDLQLTGPLPGLRLAGTSPQALGVSITVMLEPAPAGSDTAAWRMLADRFLPAA